MRKSDYGVATISRLLHIIRLLCKRALSRDYILQKRPIFMRKSDYGVATISRLLQIIGPCCRISLFIGLFCKGDV